MSCFVQIAWALVLPEKNPPLSFALAQLRILLLLFLLFVANESCGTGRKTSLVGSFLHLHQTSQLLPVTHMRKEFREAKLHQAPFIRLHLLNLAPLLDDHCHTKTAIAISSPALLLANSISGTARSLPTCDIQF
ncbi:hypothetical protein HDV64DRAFT_167616 [Trichoderma sp. TUCIM 5745]